MKARIIIKTTIDFEIDEKNYKSGLSPEECLAIDIKSAQDDPMINDG